MSDTEPIMRDHADTSEEERNELRKINQDNTADDTVLGGIGNAAGALTRPLQGNQQNEVDLGDEAALNDREQRHG